MEEMIIEFCNSRSDSKYGFSIIDLMVTIAIVSILASIAIPNFHNYLLRAKASDARSTLGHLYVFEKTFFAEYNSYSSRLDQIGFSADGTLYYNFGFFNDNAFVPANGGPLGSATCINTCGVGGAAICSSGITWTCAPSACFNLDGLIQFRGTAGSGADSTGFLAEAHAHLDEGVCDIATESFLTGLDTWTIDENKNLLRSSKPDNLGTSF